MDGVGIGYEAKKRRTDDIKGFTSWCFSLMCGWWVGTWKGIQGPCSE